MTCGAWGSLPTPPASWQAGRLAAARRSSRPFVGLHEALSGRQTASPAAPGRWGPERNPAVKRSDRMSRRTVPATVGPVDRSQHSSRREDHMGDIVAMIDDLLPVPQAIHLDQVCDRFESVWKSTGSGQQGPRIEEYLTDTPEAERSTLLHQLILLDVDYRRLRGESPKAEEYTSRFAGLSSRWLAEAFPAPPASPPVEGGTTVALPPFSPQLRSDRYIVRQFHARGGIGEIWLADDAEIGRQVALKRLRKKPEEQQERFLAEAQITGQLQHPGIVPVHDLGLDGEGRPFYIMTFIRGQTLKAAIEEYHSGSTASSEPAEVRFCRLLE